MVIVKRALLIACFLTINIFLILPSQGISNSISVETSPSTRYGHDMVYDQGNGRTILFGGVLKSERHSNETWSFNSTTKKWDCITTNIDPGLIAHHSMAYSSIHEKIVCFGGLNDVGNVLNETWIFNCISDEWREVFPTLAPPPRADASLYFDSVNEKFILFGGYKGESEYFSNDLWMYDITTNVWTDITPLTSPPDSYGHRMVYDNINHQGILFGGRVGSGVKNDLWIYYYHNNSWKKTDQESKPTTRYWHTMIYDSTDQQIIIFGGRESQYISTNILNDSWSYSPSQNNWVEFSNSIVPPTSSACLVYDSTNHLAILFGGVSRISPTLFMNGTWLFDLQQKEWLNLNSSNGRTINSYPEFTIIFFVMLSVSRKTKQRVLKGE